VARCPLWVPPYGGTLPDISLLTLTTSHEREAVRVALSGELDMSSALVFDEELRRIEADDLPRTLVLDLRRLKFLDSTGLRLIWSAHARARRCGRMLKVVPGTAAVKRIFRLTGMNERLDIVEDCPKV
jgi:anti-sigma B factor antagonist